MSSDNNNNNNNNNSLQKYMTNFCAIHRDEIVFEDKYKKQYKYFSEEEKKYKTFLEQYLGNEHKTCIPLKIPTDDGNVQKMYIRFKPKTTQKSVTEDSFKTAIEHYPSNEDLYRVFKNLDDPKATLSDVYAAWIIEILYKQNTIKHTAFEFTSSGERKKSTSSKSSKSKSKKNNDDNDDNDEETKNNNSIHVPSEVMEAASYLLKIQSNKKQLSKFKKEKITEFIVEKKQYEPVLDQFLSSKPENKQEQKISMNIQGETKPFYLKKVIETPSLSLTLAKSKPIVFQSVQNTFKSILPSVYSRPFDPKFINELEVHKDFLNVLFSEFRTKLQQYKTSHTKVVSSIVLEEHKARGSKRKTHGNNTDDDDNADDNIDGE
jgi:hypothetical protein